MGVCMETYKINSIKKEIISFASFLCKDNEQLLLSLTKEELDKAIVSFEDSLLEQLRLLRENDNRISEIMFHELKLSSRATNAINRNIRNSYKVNNILVGDIASLYGYFQRELKGIQTVEDALRMTRHLGDKSVNEILTELSCYSDIKPFNKPQSERWRAIRSFNLLENNIQR